MIFKTERSADRGLCQDLLERDAMIASKMGCRRFGRDGSGEIRETGLWRETRRSANSSDCRLEKNPQLPRGKPFYRLIGALRGSKGAGLLWWRLAKREHAET